MKRASCVAVWLAVGVSLCFGIAAACDDHVGKCELEAWRAQNESGIFMLDGSATCDEGRATVRLYDGDKFLGVATGFIRGHALQAMTTNIPPYKTLAIKYSIRPRR